ncbi:hypothetical protein [Clostridium paridis]|uniref:Uncharacterized protein n=1 Tax=Clostridium paridis TaxID=2803863 RepID=A0A937K5Q2_9CLOT|nr:hypothetical protein [Clostridium paridis]MBL4933299.1 hypothetical protein [Clostridium paridis]
MKIKDKLPDVIKWVLAIILLLLCIHYYALSYGRFTANGALRDSEINEHYGPSETKKELSLEYGKIFLGKYKDWISITAVEKKIIKWYPSGYTYVLPINNSEKITQSFEGTTTFRDLSKNYVFGYVNDPNITSVRLYAEINSKETIMDYSIDSSKMFIFYWDTDNKGGNLVSLSGFDKDNNLVYIFKYPY